MASTRAWLVVVLVAASPVSLGGCTALFPFAASAGGDAATQDGGTDAGRDAAVADAGGDAGEPSHDAGADAAVCVADVDGDEYPCQIDCNDADPLLHPDAPWPTFELDEIARSDNHFDFLIDAEGGLFVAYADENDDLQLATPDANGWVPRLIADASENARQIDLAGSMNGLIACFWDEGNDGGPLRAWTQVDGGVADVATGQTAPGPTCAIGADRAGDVHVAWYEVTSGRVLHRVRAGESWGEAEVVGTARATGFDAYWSRIALVPAEEGRPWITYRDDVDQALVLARSSGGAWVLERSSYEGRFPAIRFADDTLELCFKETNSNRMAYGTWTVAGGFTDAELVGNPQDDDVWCSLERHREAPVVAWGEEPAGQEPFARVARRGVQDLWDPAALPVGEGEQPRRPRLAVDLGGHLHVVYLDQASGTLRHGVLHEDCD